MAKFDLVSMRNAVRRLGSDPLVYKTTSSLCCCNVTNLSLLAIIYDLSRIK